MNNIRRFLSFIAIALIATLSLVATSSNNTANAAPVATNPTFSLVMEDPNSGYFAPYVHIDPSNPSNAKETSFPKVSSCSAVVVTSSTTYWNWAAVENLVNATCVENYDTDQNLDIFVSGTSTYSALPDIGLDDSGPISYSHSVPQYDGVLDFAGTSSWSFGDNYITVTSAYTITDAAFCAKFVGASGRVHVKGEFTTGGVFWTSPCGTPSAVASTEFGKSTVTFELKP